MEHTFDVRIRGAEHSMLVMHNPAAMLESRDPRGTIPLPEVEAKRGRYVVPGTDDLCIPHDCLRASILKAGASFKVAARMRANRVLGACLRIEPLFVPLLQPSDGERIREYEVYVKRAVVGTASVLRARPRIAAWAAEFALVYDDELLPNVEFAKKLLGEVLEYAGKFQGIMEERPSAPKKPGPMGRFLVEKMEWVR